MFANSRARRPRRRGIVLVLILAMLSIMALIGVTFATISGQAQVGARFYAQAQANPAPQTIFDFALEQLVNDTDNPKSMIRGHSLLRDMYGHDGQNNKYLPRLPDPSGAPLAVAGFTTANGVYVISTNIPTYNDSTSMALMPSLYGMNFVGWTLRLQQWVFDPGGYPVYRVSNLITQTFQVMGDDASGQTHTLTLSEPDLNPLLVQPGSPGPGSLPSGYYAANIFELDGRYQFAFNGLGLTYGTGAVRADRPNFLFNSPYDYTNGFTYTPNVPVAFGYNDPNRNVSNSPVPAPAMDEPYDAPDSNNMFLGVVSADGSVIIPTFHRPNMIVYDAANATNPDYNDWINYPSTYPNAAQLNAARRAKFLRPRKADHPASGDSFPDLVPDLSGTPATNPNYGKITYDVDSDGDGVPEAVWVDLGYPVQHDQTGRMYKPLFAITVIGLNGKFPLNTVGNLQRRDSATGNRAIGSNPLVVNYLGNALTVPGDHASHLGYSPFEINPKFAFATNGNDGLSDLQGLLVGNPNANPPTSGRYGELNAFKIVDSLGNPAPQLPQAGRSYQSNGLNSDFFDANYNGTDFYPNYVYNNNKYTAYPELADVLDANGGPQLPAERFRRFVTPLDTTGNGLVMEYDQTPATSPGLGLPVASLATIKYGLGFDSNGRASFFEYFRPPGVPADAVADSNADGDLTDEDITKNTLNKLHGFEYHRNPSGETMSGLVPAREFMARAPFNFNATGDPTLMNKRFPTYDDGTLNAFGTGVNSYSPPTLTQGMYPDGGLALNEDFQINLYAATPYDDLFTNSDLEWLYRQGDPDFSGLDSRLGRLVSSFNGVGGLTQRRLFSTDSWEPIHYAPDPSNANFYVAGNMPSIAHGGRKVNLNYPLPPSGNPREAFRLKWCRETYDMLKRVIYPNAGWPLPLPNPQTGLTPPPGMTNSEFALRLAELGQYVVNIVDFRDPDATMTRFVNPDLDELAAESGTDVDGDGSNFSPAGVALNTTGTGTLVQWGMEYLPIALNEVLAYQFTRRDLNASPQDQETKRLFLEIVNMLTEDADGNDPSGKGGKASDLDLKGWGVIITGDDPDYKTNTPGVTLPTVAERPNSVTGQLSSDTVKTHFQVLAGTNAAPAGLGDPVEPLSPDGLPDQGSGQKYYVLSNDIPVGGLAGLDAEAKTDTPTQNGKIPDVIADQLPKLTKGNGDRLYMWVHLLRPANPNDPTSEKVVVDSFRFPYFEAGVTIDMSTKPQSVMTPPSKPIYSVGRSQPYRGGHAVPVPKTTAGEFVPYYGFGYSEQSSVGTDDTNNHGIFYADKPTGGYIPLTVTTDFKDTLGDRNDNWEDWDYFVFNDRDFNSVAELLLVPSSPPGLFTKQFAELPQLPNPNGLEIFPDNDTNGTYDKSYPVTVPPDPTTLNKALDLPEPHPYPYLPHKFYYSADTTGRPLRWYEMFELFEVPSPVLGAIGPVNQGDNGDWLRSEVKPGLLNLNLIYDEEVFFGLIDDPRLNRSPVADPALPQFVTAIYPEVHPTTPGAPSASYAPQNRGYFDNVSGTPNNNMKAAFADFLKLRAGGSGFVGTVPGTTYGNIWPDKPFWGPSVLHPAAGLDIFDTVMRPARLEIYSGDMAIQPDWTEIPPRRLFQIADYFDPTDTADMNDRNNKAINSPASETGGFNNATVGGDHVNLFNTNADLFYPGAFAVPPLPGTRSYGLGGAYAVEENPPGSGNYRRAQDDRRRHPYWRSEMLQKVMNLTTTRTHQFAVWITVGYFEVIQEGNPQALVTPGNDPMLAIDQLGKEIGKESGSSVRHRMFFIIDRSIAAGFDPSDPGDFRDLVRFSRQIQ
jgi:hypothetical protein